MNLEDQQVKEICLPFKSISPKQIQFSNLKSDYKFFLTEERQNQPKNNRNSNDNLDQIFCNSITSHIKNPSENEYLNNSKSKLKIINTKGKNKKSPNILLLIACISSTILEKIKIISQQNHINYLVAINEKQALLIHKKQIINSSQIYNIILDEQMAEHTELINQIVSIESSNHSQTSNIYVIRENVKSETKERFLGTHVVYLSLNEFESIYSRKNL